MQEEFKSLKGLVDYGNNYEVSNLGRVRNHKTGRILKFDTAHTGYHQVKLSYEGKKKNCLVHRAVALAFLPNPDNKREVNHKDGSKTNNLLSNLEWATSKENQEHAMEHGLQRVLIGEECGIAKLTEDKVREIRRLHSTGEYSHSQLGKLFDIGKRNITQIVNYRTWKHVV